MSSAVFAGKSRTRTTTGSINRPGSIATRPAMVTAQLVEELADVYIMAEQMRLMFGEAFEGAMDLKTMRLAQLVGVDLTGGTADDL